MKYTLYNIITIPLNPNGGKKVDHNIKEVEIFGVVKISNSKAIYFDILVILGYVNHMLFMCLVSKLSLSPLVHERIR